MDVNVGVTKSAWHWDRHHPRWSWEGRGSRVWPGGWGQWGGQGHTFAVHAVAPRPSWHGHLVLVAAGVTALPTEPLGARAAARVDVTVAALALAPWGGRGGVSGRLRALGYSSLPRGVPPACTHACSPAQGAPSGQGHTRGTGDPQSLAGSGTAHSGGGTRSPRQLVHRCMGGSPHSPQSRSVLPGGTNCSQGSAQLVRPSFLQP